MDNSWVTPTLTVFLEKGSQTCRTLAVQFSMTEKKTNLIKNIIFFFFPQ